MTYLFLFGAGASYGSGPCHPTQPPLGRDLFRALRSEGGLAARLDQSFASKFEQDFETGMDYLRKKRSDLMTAFLLDMARFFAPFTPLPGNNYIKLLEVLGTARAQSVMVTLNYELLIEIAICLCGARVAYEWPATVAGNVSVLKIHGSCNFLPNLGRGSITGVTYLHGESASSANVNAPLDAVSTTQEILDFCNRNDSLAPAMALYSPTKQVFFGPKGIETIRCMWTQAAEAASQIFLIGVRVHPVDKHIWEPIGRSQAPLHYVGFEVQEFQSWANANGRANAFALAKTFDEAVLKISSTIR